MLDDPTGAERPSRLRIIKRLCKDDELGEIVVGEATRHRLDHEISQPWMARVVRYRRPGFPPQILLA